MQSYETVIIGAGPAGLNCAQKLAEAGKSVLLLEQNSEIGPKVCAGGFTGADLEYLGLPDDLLDFKLKEVAFSTPMQKSKLKFDKFVIYTVDRKNLGQWQLAKLKKTGAEVKTKSRVTKIEKDHVLVNGSEKIGFNYLVGADGSASFTRRFIGIPSKEVGIAIQYLVPNTQKYDFEYIFSSGLFGAGYAWIFPHKDYTSVGTGCNPKHMSSKKLRENFGKWLKARKISVEGLELQGSPINYDYRGYKFGNIFLAGDAAGVASGLTGEGIYQALISGEEVAKMILDINYVSVKMEEIIKANKRHTQILEFLHRSGGLRKIEFELVALMLKSNWGYKIIINAL